MRAGDSKLLSANSSQSGFKLRLASGGGVLLASMFLFCIRSAFVLVPECCFIVEVEEPVRQGGREVRAESSSTTGVKLSNSLIYSRGLDLRADLWLELGVDVGCGAGLLRSSTFASGVERTSSTLRFFLSALSFRVTLLSIALSYSGLRFASRRIEWSDLRFDSFDETVFLFDCLGFGFSATSV